MPVVPKSIFANPHYLAVWLKASKEALQSNPDDEHSLYVHFALNELSKLFSEPNQSNIELATKRQQVFDYFEKAATKGDPRAMFFAGLCFLDGLGRPKNPMVGNHLIELAAVWRLCDLAINYINLCLAFAYMYGNKENNIQPNLRKAIEYLHASGPIGLQAMKGLDQHLKAQELRLAQQQLRELPIQPELVQAYRRPMLVSA